MPDSEGQRKWALIFPFLDTAWTRPWAKKGKAVWAPDDNLIRDIFKPRVANIDFPTKIKH